MIKVTVEEVRTAYRAFRRINEEVRLPQKAAWRVARLLNHLKPVVKDFEETQLKLFLDADGVQTGGSVQLEPLERGEDESPADWLERQRERRETINKLSNDIRELDRNEVEIAYDHIPLTLFEDDDKTPVEKRRQFSANDFADAGPFLVETEKKE